MNWNLDLAALMLLGLSLASWLFVNRQGYKFVLVYTLFSLAIYIDIDLFLYLVPLLLLLIFYLNPTEIRGVLILGVTLVTIAAVTSITTLADGSYNVFLVRDLTSGTSIATASLLILPKHRDYALALTFGLFAIFFYSFANQYSPFLRVSLPFACLSLLPYLGMTVIGKHFEGSLAHRYLTKALKKLAIRLKVGGKSKYTGMVLEVLRLK